MNINPKDRKNYHGLTVEEKKELFTAIHRVVQAAKVNYLRMYTEPRLFGYRCKLWCGKLTMQKGQAIAKQIKLALASSSLCNQIDDVVYHPTTYTAYRYMHSTQTITSAFRIYFK